MNSLHKLEFSSPLTQEIYGAILAEDNSRMQAVLSTIPEDQLSETVLELDKERRLNLLSVALEIANYAAANQLMKFTPLGVLNKVVLQEDHTKKDCYHRYILKITRAKYDHKIDIDLDRFCYAKFHDVKITLPPAKPIEFRAPQFNIAKQLYELIDQGNDEQLERFIKASSKPYLSLALQEQDDVKKMNVFSYAAHINNSRAIDIMASYIDVDLLKEVVAQQDNTGWTAFHHLALMVDNGKCYKKMKELTGINTKTMTQFFCESPSMLRKYLRPNPRRFSANHDQKDFHIYLREGVKINHERSEHRLTFEELKQKYGSKFTKVPEYFKIIPHAERDFFKTCWTNGIDNVGRNEEHLSEVDRHLKAIYEAKEETGVALATIEQTDKDEPISPDLNLGLGVEARRDFKEKELVTLYGGEQRTSDRQFTDDYTYHYIDGIDGLQFRAYGSMCAHSAPNIDFNNVTSLLGIIFVVMHAISDIFSGDQVCESYGHCYFGQRDIIPIEIRPEARRLMEENLSKDAQTTLIQRYLAIPYRNVIVTK
jgi:hypothetical protein